MPLWKSLIPFTIFAFHFFRGNLSFNRDNVQSANVKSVTPIVTIQHEGIVRDHISILFVQ